MSRWYLSLPQDLAMLEWIVEIIIGMCIIEKHFVVRCNLVFLENLKVIVFGQCYLGWTHCLSYRTEMFWIYNLEWLWVISTLPFHWNMSLFPHYEIIVHNHLQMTVISTNICNMEKKSYIFISFFCRVFTTVFQVFLVEWVSAYLSIYNQINFI